MARSPFPAIPTNHKTHNGQHWFEIYGRLFEFDMANPQSKAEAYRVAVEHGKQHQADLSAKVKRPLTRREQITGKIDRPAPPPRGPEPCGESESEANTTRGVNNILSRLHKDLERPLSPNRRDQTMRRIAMWERVKKERETREAQVIVKENLADAVDHARTTLDLLNHDPEATPEARIAAEDRLRALEARGPAVDYWRACQDACVPTPTLASDGLPEVPKSISA